MSRYLLDTVVLSAMRRADRDPALVAWLDTCQADDLYLCAVTMMEIEVGILCKEKADRTQAAVLRRWFDAVSLEFADRIVPVTHAAALAAARITMIRSRGYSDTLIAATALVNDIPVVTRNLKDFVDIPQLRVIDPDDV
ncbi:MAG: type II toxin-antitoxin system VapC family toxin [Micrococcales bacterium]|nr:type II toxin-antitoxin system VapC family toxin [Micrococcales bacterium]